MPKNLPAVWYSTASTWHLLPSVLYCFLRALMKFCPIQQISASDDCGHSILHCQAVLTFRRRLHCEPRTVVFICFVINDTHFIKEKLIHSEKVLPNNVWKQNLIHCPVQSILIDTTVELRAAEEVPATRWPQLSFRSFPFFQDRGPTCYRKHVRSVIGCERSSPTWQVWSWDTNLHSVPQGFEKFYPEMIWLAQLTL